MTPGGISGWVKTAEYTYSEDTGHHLHIHAAIVLEDPTSAEMVEEMGHRAFGRRERGLIRKGFSAGAKKGGLDMRPVRLTRDSIEAVAEYVSKAAFELSSQVTKKGRGGSRSAFEILGDACQGTPTQSNCGGSGRRSPRVRSKSRTHGPS